MKKILLLQAFAFFCILSFPQKLLDVYKKGPVKLVPESSYGAKNDWDKLFNIYYDTLDQNVARRWNDKKIVVAPDGSVFMSHKNRHEIWKFGPDGTFLKSFGSKGGKAYQFPMLPSVQPVVDGKYVFTDDVNGRLKFFDTDGNYFKSITLKYMTRQFRPVGNGEIMLVGWVLWHTRDAGTGVSKNRSRILVIRLNINTGEEKTIFSAFEDDLTMLRDSIHDNVPVGVIGGKYLPAYLTLKKPEVVLLSDGRFMIFDKTYGDVSVYDKTGKKTGEFKLDITPLKITKEDALDNYESARKMYLRVLKLAEEMPDTSVKKVSKGERGTKPGTLIAAYPNKYELIKRTRESMANIEKLKDVDYYFPYLPYFSNIITDDEGNLLVFEFTSRAKTETNMFNVVAYDRQGQTIARTSFVCDDYDLNFSGDSFIFHNGFVYAVAKLKNSSGVPLRLVKFRMVPRG